MNALPWSALQRSVTVCLALLAPVALGGPARAQSSLPPVSAPSSAAERTALTRGRALLADFYAVKVEGLWQAFTPELRDGWGSLGAFRSFREAGVQTYGAEREVLREWTFTERGVTYYVRSARFEGDPETLWNVVVGFDAVGRISVFAIVEDEDGGAPGPSA